MKREILAWSVTLFIMLVTSIVPVIVVRQLCLWLVQVLEAIHCLTCRWVVVPMLDVTGLIGRSQPEEPNYYHYHGLRDWLVSKLGAVLDPECGHASKRKVMTHESFRTHSGYRTQCGSLAIGSGVVLVAFDVPLILRYILLATVSLT